MHTVNWCSSGGMIKNAKMCILDTLHEFREGHTGRDLAGHTVNKQLTLANKKQFC